MEKGANPRQASYIDTRKGQTNQFYLVNNELREDNNNE
ncbi:hypothetical protein DOT_3933 [Desulfosporosinus sp. OT]|nr:hypothetical protein DOT_3933 [Desulfosporosinus sp. OT]